MGKLGGVGGVGGVGGKGDGFKIKSGKKTDQINKDVKPEKTLGKKISDGFGRIGKVFSRSTGSKASETLKEKAAFNELRNASDTSKDVDSSESEVEVDASAVSAHEEGPKDETIHDLGTILKEVRGGNINVLERASPEITNNANSMGQIFVASKNNPEVIKHASDRLKNDSTFMMNRLKSSRNPQILKHASDELKNNKDFMLRATNQNHKAFQHLGDTLKNDKAFILKQYEEAAIGDRREGILNAAGPEVKQYIEVRNNLISELKNCESDQDFEDAFKSHNEFKNDEGLMREVSIKNPMVLKFANEELKQNKEFMREAVHNNIGAFKHASEELRNDKEFVKEAVRPHVLGRESAAQRHNYQLEANLLQGKGKLSNDSINSFQNSLERLQQLDNAIKEILPGWEPRVKVRE